MALEATKERIFPYIPFLTERRIESFYAAVLQRSVRICTKIYHASDMALIPNLVPRLHFFDAGRSGFGITISLFTWVLHFLLVSPEGSESSL